MGAGMTRHLVVLANPDSFDRAGDYLACHMSAIDALRRERRFNEFTTQWQHVTCPACQTTSEYATEKKRYPSDE